MTEKAPSPIRPTDDEARAMARELIANARFGALGVLDAETGAPFVSRVALAVTDDGAPMTLISQLSRHTAALSADPRCSLMVGEPGPRGDPLTHPRLTLQCRAGVVPRPSPQNDDLRALYLRANPKAKLYIDFGDFRLVRLDVIEAHLNGGFGKAYRLTPADLAG